MFLPENFAYAPHDNQPPGGFGDEQAEDIAAQERRLRYTGFVTAASAAVGLLPYDCTYEDAIPVVNFGTFFAASFNPEREIQQMAPSTPENQVAKLARYRAYQQVGQHLRMERYDILTRCQAFTAREVFPFVKAPMRPNTKREYFHIPLAEAVAVLFTLYTSKDWETEQRDFVRRQKAQGFQYFSGSLDAIVTYARKMAEDTGLPDLAALVKDPKPLPKK